MAREILFYSDFPFGYHNTEAETKMALFADRGYRVVYVEQLGIKNPRLRHAIRIARALGRHEESGGPPGLSVVSPKLLPPRRAPLVDSLNRAWLRRQLLSRLETPDEAIFWLRYPTPELIPLVERADPRLVVYEVVDAHERSRGMTQRLARVFRRAEDRLLTRADVVFAWSEPLRAQLATRHPNVVLAPAAVHLAAFAAASDEGRPRGRVAAYTGSLDFRLDIDLLVEVIGRLPAWSFVFAGPVESQIERRLAAFPNAVFHGPVPPEEVPAILTAADVCLMPYRQDGFTQNLFPIKLVEYLAAGKPVVSTPLPCLRAFGSAIRVADHASAFADATESAVAEDSSDRRRDRVERASSFSWEKRIDEMEQEIERALRAS